MLTFNKYLNVKNALFHTKYDNGEKKRIIRNCCKIRLISIFYMKRILTTEQVDCLSFYIEKRRIGTGLTGIWGKVWF